MIVNKTLEAKREKEIKERAAYYENLVKQARKENPEIAEYLQPYSANGYVLGYRKGTDKNVSVQIPRGEGNDILVIDSAEATYRQVGILRHNMDKIIGEGHNIIVFDDKNTHGDSLGGTYETCKIDLNEITKRGYPGVNELAKKLVMSYAYTFTGRKYFDTSFALYISNMSDDNLKVGISFARALLAEIQKQYIKKTTKQIMVFSHNIDYPFAKAFAPDIFTYHVFTTRELLEKHLDTLEQHHFKGIVMFKEDLADDKCLASVDGHIMTLENETTINSATAKAFHNTSV